MKIVERIIDEYNDIQGGLFMNRRKNSMLEGSLWDKLIYFALPLAASSTLQQLFNTADTAIVGRFAGSNALAAVGANAVVVTLFINALTGLSVGANVVIAQYIGAHREDKIQNAVHTTILFSIMSHAVIVFIFQFCGNLIMQKQPWYVQTQV